MSNTPHIEKLDMKFDNDPDIVDKINQLVDFANSLREEKEATHLLYDGEYNNLGEIKKGYEQKEMKKVNIVVCKGSSSGCNPEENGCTAHTTQEEPLDVKRVLLRLEDEIRKLKRKSDSDTYLYRQGQSLAYGKVLELLEKSHLR